MFLFSSKGSSIRGPVADWRSVQGCTLPLKAIGPAPGKHQRISSIANGWKNIQNRVIFAQGEVRKSVTSRVIYSPVQQLVVVLML